MFGRTKPRSLGRVKSVDRDADAIVIERKGEPDAKIPFSDVVGKVVWNTRQAERPEKG